MAQLTKNPHVIIDADVLLYRCGFAAEKTKYLVELPDGSYHKFDSAKEAKEFEEGLKGTYRWSRKEVEPASHAVTNLTNTLKGILDLYEPRAVSLYLTGKGNFRDEAAVSREYKGNRDPAHRPKHFQTLRSLLITNGARVINGFEADDAIAAEAFQIKDESKYVIVSNDKDLDQIPGHHYDWTTRQSWYVSPRDAIRVFYTQLLCGDSTDNIPGIMSEKKALEVIHKCDTPQDCALEAVKAYHEKYGPDDFIPAVTEVANLVWIKRSLIEGTDGYVSPLEQHLLGAENAN